MSSVVAEDLHKSFGKVKAVQGVGFEIPPGEAFGLLGPNGAGKSTTIGMLLGLIEPDSGRARILGADPSLSSTRRGLGVAPQALSLYEELTARENLAFFGGLYDLTANKLRQRVDAMLEFSGLTQRASERVSKFSGGMKRRLNIACALVHEPSIVLLDEPTVGVDPQSRNHILESIEHLKSDGLTVIFTTHYMEEAERLCDRVAIVDQGKLLALDRVERLLAEHGGDSVLEAEFAATPAEQLMADGKLRPEWLVNDKLRIECADPLEKIAELARAGVSLATLQVKRPDLENVFLRLTGRSLRDE